MHRAALFGLVFLSLALGGCGAKEPEGDPYATPSAAQPPAPAISEPERKAEPATPTPGDSQPAGESKSKPG